MEQTEFHYLITFSKLFLKLGTGQDTSEECAAIKSFSEDDQFDIVQQLMERLTEHGIQFAELIVSSIKAIGLLDENYVDDFFRIIQLRTGTQEEIKAFLREIISKEDYQGETMLDIAYWRSLTLMAINVRDNDLLEQYIVRLEAEASKAE